MSECPIGVPDMSGVDGFADFDGCGCNPIGGVGRSSARERKAVPDAMIDLGDAGPWAPPERSPGGPRRRLGVSGRRIAVLVVAVVAAALLGADDPGLAGPLFRLPDRVLDARIGDGRL